MAAAAILDNFEWHSPLRLTIYLYSAQRAVIFAIAQLFCYHKISFHSDMKWRDVCQCAIKPVQYFTFVHG